MIRIGYMSLGYYKLGYSGYAVPTTNEDVWISLPIYPPIRMRKLKRISTAGKPEWQIEIQVGTTMQDITPLPPETGE